MRINVNGGHCPKAPGASGYLDELAEDRKVKDALIRILRGRGHTVTDSTSDAENQREDLAYQARAANASGAELAISVHFNAGGGIGPEVWYYTGNKAGAVWASKISSALAEALELRNRGAKSSNGFYWLRHTNMPALIVEVCFVDTVADADAYLRIGPEAVAKAIADAVVGADDGDSAPAGDSPQKPQNPISGAQLDVDGYWGTKTTKALQKALGTPVDGIVSGQYLAYHDDNPGLTTGWQWSGKPTGSLVIKALQKKIGADPDGIAGPVTFAKLQAYLGTPIDGEIWRQSAAVKEMQRRLNAGNF